MALPLTQLVRRHGAFVSAVTASAVALVIVLQHALSALVSSWQAIPYLSEGASFISPGFVLGSAALTAIPFGVGFFVSLWLIAPIAEELGLPHVATRAILATGVGATVVFVVHGVLAILGAFSFGGALFGNSFPFPTFDGGGALFGLGTALTTAILTFISTLPLGVLAGVLLWHWRKDHPPRHPLSGLIDL